ncbi:MAG: AI-2E family transporter [Candidatus Marinimicrobia bacterium]|nr:AI-2E family transporter [Candidatus Neomarinimicrobiota bacterium]
MEKLANEKIRRHLRHLVILIAACISVYFLRELRNIFIPLILAVFFAFMFSPMISFLTKKRVPNFVIILLLLVIVSVVLFLIGTLVFASISSFAGEFPKYQDKLVLTFQNVLSQFKIPMEDAQYFFRSKVNWFELANRISLQSFITSTMGSFLDFIVSLILMILILLFIIAERKKLEERLAALILNFKGQNRPEIIPEIQKKIQTYITRKTIISFGTAVSAMIIASFFKLDFIIIIGMITFLLNFIPSIGSIIATLFPMLIFLLQYGLNGNFLLVSTLLISSQFLFGNVLDPRWLGQGLKLSPLFIIVSLFFWHWLWGPIGMIICVPLQSILGLILQYTGGFYALRAIMGETLPTDTP